MIWGEYVRPDGTLSHFLSEQSGQPGKFVNAGVNGLFPLAFEGLIRDYGEPLRHRKVILHCNVLWMSSPKADLHTEKEERFNHADLVPQFSPRIPCYKADLNRRLCRCRRAPLHLLAMGESPAGRLLWTEERPRLDSRTRPTVVRRPVTQTLTRTP